MTRHPRSVISSKRAPASGHDWTSIDWAICLSLVILVAAIYGRALACDFLNYDDDGYVTKNDHVLGGLSWESFRWAFTGTQGANWHPLTTLSHILDVQFHGLNPAGHHATNVILHAINVGAVFLVFRTMTGERWPSAAVAALFGLHPLHVESVAWVSERKDVLSGLFFALTLAAYARYVRCHASEAGGCAALRPLPSALRFLTSGNYWFVVLFFALGLMSKPMLVTLPFVLLLLDYWPLRRFPRGSFQFSDFGYQLFEKLPLFVLSGISCLVTWRVQQAWGAVREDAAFPFGVRILHALVSYVRYLAKMVWPDGMAVYYPYPIAVPLWETMGAGLLLIALTVAFVLRCRSSPWLPVGWFWFLGTLVPVIGLVQVGTQAIADRYTYIPSLGLFIMLAWGADATARRLRLPASAVAAAAGIVLAASAAGIWNQLGYWRNNLTLFGHALSVTKENWVAHHSLGEALVDLGRLHDALPHYREAVRLQPRRLDIRSEWANLLMHAGDAGQALDQYFEVVRRHPTVARAHFQLARALASYGRSDEAVEHYREALRLWPDRPEVLQALAWIHATDPRAERRDGAEAVRLAESAQRLAGADDARTLDILAAALAETGRYSEATENARRALELAIAQNNTPLADEFRVRLHLYEAGFPYHEEARNR